MENLDFVRFIRNSAYELYLHNSSNYILLNFIGIWNDPSEVKYYIDDIKKILTKISGEFSLIIDFRQYKGSSAEFMTLHVEALKLAISSGLNRTAVLLNNNSLLKVTIEYIFEQARIKPSYFANEYAAEQWLECNKAERGLEKIELILQKKKLNKKT